jgi:hypothetical protein
MIWARYDYEIVPAAVVKRLSQLTIRARNQFTCMLSLPMLSLFIKNVCVCAYTYVYVHVYVHVHGGCVWDPVVHNIVNSIMYALFQIPSVTVQRCRNHGGLSTRLTTGTR